MNRRNGKIELMRFAFCMCVLFFHLNGDFWSRGKMLTEHISFFASGYYGVEYFFLLSGFLTAQKAYEQTQHAPRLDEHTEGRDTGSETLRFLWHKLKPILPYHIAACLIYLALSLAYGQINDLEAVISSLPNLFLIHRTGLHGVYGKTILSVEWYLGALFLALAVLYPLLRRFYYTFARLVAPFTVLTLLGWLSYTTGTLRDVDIWCGFTFNSNLFAFGELCLGVSCFELCRGLRKRSFTTPQRLLLSLLELFGWAVTLYYTVSAPEVSELYGYYVLFPLGLSIAIAFSRQGLLGQLPFWDNRFFRFLGAISLPIYLLQNIPRIIIANSLSFLPRRIKFLIACVLVIGGGALAYWIVETVRRRHALRAR